MTKREKEFKLHYVGKGMYNITSFENEAKRLGVQRALSFSQLKTLKFGDVILLARFIPEKPVMEIDLKQIPPKLTGKQLSSIPPQAEVFGYFTVDGISHNLPKEETQTLTNKLDIVEVDNTPFGVSRACGSYSVGSVAYIRDNLETLLQKIENTFTVHKEKLTEPCLTPEGVLDFCNCHKCTHGDPLECIGTFCDHCTSTNFSAINSHKWFINGKYYPLTSFILSPAKFLRGIQTVKIKDLNLKTQRQANSAVVWIYNYRQRHYLPKARRNKLENPPKEDPFRDAF